MSERDSLVDNACRETRGISRTVFTKRDGGFRGILLNYADAGNPQAGSAEKWTVKFRIVLRTVYVRSSFLAVFHESPLFS